MAYATGWDPSALGPEDVVAREVIRSLYPQLLCILKYVLARTPTLARFLLDFVARSQLRDDYQQVITVDHPPHVDTDVLHLVKAQLA